LFFRPANRINQELIEGNNRQMRRVIAAIGHPTLQWIRVRIGISGSAICRLASGDFCPWRKGMM
jgi:16S rRNA U516 pseudouridylate synthase RsuA-like enzyme